MEPKYYTQSPLIILFFFLLCFNFAQAVCKPRNLNLRYLTIPSTSPNSPSNSQPAMPPTKPQPGQFFPSWRPAGPPPSRTASAPNPSSQPPEKPPPAGNSISLSPSSTSFLRHPSDNPKDSPRSNLFTQSTYPKSASSFVPPNPAIQQICKNTDYPDICVSSVAPFLPLVPKLDPVAVLEMTIKAATTHAKLSLAAASKLVLMNNIARGTAAALSDCKDMYGDALDGLQSAMDAIQSRDIGTINSMLSGVVTDAVTCGDGFEGENSPLGDYDDKLHKMASNCLAIASLIK
ncbi:unnamed protein product [Prunus armeniaca]|uniref:Pectinesterase inhibitor domain-containing protein n=1 Tax=Prunus armeniaca TaxID=36596 RepID=A0A6J5UEN5_PRUAR|nr:hypothetical protein GBA52_004573 [Prunus armeniaca]CAB4274906.1 unnamed protein product [Prunus armeniaca]